jgi:glycosyltransferase involved in cell wall biosynthesis
MIANFKDHRVSVAVVYSDRLPYGKTDFAATLKSLVAQDHENLEILVVDGRGPDAKPDFDGVPAGKLRHLPGRYANRAAMYNAALKAAQGDLFLAIYNAEKQIVLRRSAVQAFVMAATRGHTSGLIYSDYELIDAAGARKDVHLLEWHEGRLREMTDLGLVHLHPTALLREIGGWNEKYNGADLYDLRLRTTAKDGAVHISNRYAGALYAVAAPPKAHNVFDYLLTDKKTQLELEDALTEHLKRTGAYLAPGAHVRKVEYTAAEESAFKDCIASVVIPVNNRPQFIGRAIESIQAQTLRNVEVIVVVNGGPNDPTAPAVRRYLEGGDTYQPGGVPVRLLVVDINNLGLCFNSGLSVARGKYYVQLDSDDRLKPDAIEKILRVYESDPTIGMVIGSYEVWVLDEKTGQINRDERVPVVTHDEWTADNGRNNLLRINGAGAPRSAHIKVIREVGWFGVNDDPYCRNYGEDYDLVLRISERYTIGRVWDPIYEVIRHSGGTDHSIDQVTIDRNDNAKDGMRLHALQRRRRLNGAGGVRT